MTVKKSQIITEAKPHTIKKFEVIETYIKSWAQKLMLNRACNGLIYIDCMCNSGVYRDLDGNIVYGSPVRVAEALRDVANTYREKMVYMYLNDINEARIVELRKHLPEEESNFKIVTSVNDANDLLETIGPQLDETSHYHYFLLYDPYDASIDWKALLPFFRYWGEVMINHALQDPIRAITSAKSNTAREKYEHTYLQKFEKLLPHGSDKKAYERRMADIINYVKGKREYFVASFPFYNRKGSLQYDLIHCTSNIEGFKLYKNTAWKVFGGKSAARLKEPCLQYELDFSSPKGYSVPTDENCFGIYDIAKYVQSTFAGQKDVPLDEIWNILDYHPIFPSGAFRKEIKRDLKEYFEATSRMITDEETGKRQQVMSFTD